MNNKFKPLVSLTILALSLSMLQAHLSQAADTMDISVTLPDGADKAMILDLDQPLSQLRADLINRGAVILLTDKFIAPKGEISPRDEVQWTIRRAINSGNVLSFKFREMLIAPEPAVLNTSYDLVERVYTHNTAYKFGVLQHYQDQDGVTFSTGPCRPQKPRAQAILNYDANPIPERVLKKVTPGQDGRRRIQDTTIWPHSIHAHLSMKLAGKSYGGSGVIVGPHHLLTCGHNIYDFNRKSYFEEILVYPALNENEAPFGEIKVTKAYIFKAYQDRGDERFDMALLLLDQSTGHYTGWGGLLSAADAVLSQEEIHITGYPGDKGCKQMWSMGHKIRTVKPEAFDYEIDTYEGQSGSPVWINKWGMPVVLGVHTLSNNYINSGVRLSTSKFEKIVQVIGDTYDLVIPIPLVAQGYEDIYQRFLKGVLIYRPQPGSDVGKIELQIRHLANPLGSTFDLSRCGDTGKKLSISTGYRKEKKAENADKAEFWIAPRFLIEKELKTTASYFQGIFNAWKSSNTVGIFYTWGGEDGEGANGPYVDHLTSSMDQISQSDLWDHASKQVRDEQRPSRGYVRGHKRKRAGLIQLFTVSFDDK